MKKLIIILLLSVFVVTCGKPMNEEPMKKKKFYRLKQVDKDSSLHYSPVIKK